MSISMPGVPVSHLAGVHLGFEALITRRPGQGRGQARTSRDAIPTMLLSAVGDSSTIRSGVAQTRELLDAADALVRQRYAWRGYQVKSRLELDAMLGERAKNEITFIAMDERVLLGTITLGLDSATGLRAEDTHSEAINAARAAGCRVCELTRLAVAAGPDSRTVLASLFSLVYALGRTIHGVTDVFIEVNPRHVGFYQRILGFTVAADERFCDRVGAPSVLLRLATDMLDERLQQFGLAAIAEPVLENAG
jgi:hypothetical protein